MRRLLIAVTFACLLFCSAASADVPPPSCYETAVYARPGLTRTYSLWCSRVSTAELVTHPAHGTLTDALFNGSLQFDYRADADAPESDGFDVKLSGPSGDTTVHIDIHVTPLAVNTPPHCPPETISQRSDGITPAQIGFQVMCTDAEHDNFTITGDGPGTFLNTPLPYHPIYTTWLQYRTAVTSGQEQATYTATDDLGAASDPAAISMDVGPSVDRLPACAPNPSSTDNPVNMRPGAPRRFAIICTDPDGDELSPQMRTAPSRGQITQFVVDPPSTGFWGLSHWIDVTYVPATSFVGDDHFVVGADGPRGRGTDSDFVMRARELPANSGGGCGWSGGSTAAGTPVTLTANCDDNDGDPLRATIADQPTHGVAQQPVLTPAKFGGSLISIVYTPNPGYVGSDFLTLSVGDGIGDPTRMEMQITTGQPAYTAPIYLTPPTHPVQSYPGGALGQFPARTPATQARIALGAKHVRLARKLGTAGVFVSTTTPRAAQRKALAVACPTGCLITATRYLSGQAKKAKASSAQQTHVAATAGKAAIIPLQLTKAEKRAVKRRGTGSVRFRLTVVPRAGSSASGTVDLHVRR